MVSVDKQALISQLCTASKLQGKDLEEYRARLNKMSETELSALISGDNKGENVDTVELNHSQGVNKTEITKKDAEDSAIQTIESNANQAIQMIDSQDDGNISEAYNKLKEKFDSDLAKSNVEKIVYKQLETAYFLKEAQANNLTYREYFEQRKELLYKTFPGIERFNDKQKQSLKRMIDSLSPEQVLEQQDKILSLPEAGTEGYDDSVRSFLNDFKTETTDSVIVQNKEFGMKVKTKPKDKFELADGERLMTFDEVYTLEQGVNFNKDNIQKYNESAGQFAFVNSVNQKREDIHQLLEKPLMSIKTRSTTGSESWEMLESELGMYVQIALEKLYGKDPEKVKAGLESITKGERLSNTDIAQRIMDMVDANYEKMTNGKSLDDYANQMAEDYKSAYGSKDATNLASAYVQDQEGMVQNIRTGVELVGAGVMVAGMIFFPPAALAGGAVAGFGGAGVELYNESTRDNVNTERTDELQKELVTNALLMIVGMGAGKAGSAVKTLTVKNSQHLSSAARNLLENSESKSVTDLIKAIKNLKNPQDLVAIFAVSSAKIGTDATISLLGDLALTGQIDIQGEGFAQIMSLVAGHNGKVVKGAKHVKNDIKAKFGPDARQMPDGTVYKINQDGSTTVLQDVVGVNDKAGISRTTADTPAGQSDLSTRLDNAKSREDFTAIRDEIKKMPNSPQKAELQKQYLQKWNEFSQNPARHEIKMEYKPEDGASKTEYQINKEKEANLFNSIKEYLINNSDYKEKLEVRIQAYKNVDDEISPEAIQEIENSFFIRYCSRNADDLDLPADLKTKIVNYVKDNEYYNYNKGIPEEEISLYDAVSIYNNKKSIRSRKESDLLYKVQARMDNNSASNEEIAPILDKLKTNEFQQLSDKELDTFNTLISDIPYEEFLKRVNSDNSKLATRDFKSILGESQNTEKIAELLYCSDEEFAIKQQRIKDRAEDLPQGNSPIGIKQWKNIMSMSDEDYALYQKMKPTLPEGVVITDIKKYAEMSQENDNLANLFREAGHYNEDEIYKLAELSKSNPDLVNKLAKEKITSHWRPDKPKYSVDEIQKLVEYNKINEQLMNQLIDNKFDFDGINSMFNLLKTNEKLVNDLLNGDRLENLRIDTIQDIAEIANKDAELINTILNEKIDLFDDKPQRFSNSDIVKLISDLTENDYENYDFIKYLINAKDNSGFSRFNYINIRDLAKHSKDKNLVMELLNAKTTNGDDRFTSLEIENLVPILTGENNNFAKTLLKEKVDNRYRFTGFEVINITKANEINEQLTRELINTKINNEYRFGGSDIIDIVKSNEISPSKVQELLDAKTLNDKGEIVYAFNGSSIRNYVEDQEHTDLRDKLLALKKKDVSGNTYNMFSGYEIDNVVDIYKSNPETVANLLNNEQYNILLKNINKKNVELFADKNILKAISDERPQNSQELSFETPYLDNKWQVTYKMENGSKTLFIDKNNDSFTIAGRETTTQTNKENTRVRREFSDGTVLVEEIQNIPLSRNNTTAYIPVGIKKTLYDNQGVQTRSEVITPSKDKPGAYTINVYERGLNQGMKKKPVGTVEMYGSKNQGSKAIRTVSSEDGSTTSHTIIQGPKGSGMTYQIKDKDGNIIANIERRHRKINDNHYTSSFNGQKYDMQFSDNKITVSQMNNDNNVIKTIELGPEQLDFNLIDLYKQLPGDYLFKIKEMGTKVVLDDTYQKADKNNACFNSIDNTIYVSPELKNNPFIFAHELGHAIDLNSGNIHSNPELVKIYQEELETYKSKTSDAEGCSIDYFTSSSRGGGKRIPETIAESNALMSGLSNENFSDVMLRGVVLQQHFPKTIAKISELTQTTPIQKNMPADSEIKLNNVIGSETPEFKHFSREEIEALKKQDKNVKEMSNGDVFRIGDDGSFTKIGTTKAPLKDASVDLSNTSADKAKSLIKDFIKNNQLEDIKDPVIKNKILELQNNELDGKTKQKAMALLNVFKAFKDNNIDTKFSQNTIDFITVDNYTRVIDYIKTNKGNFDADKCVADITKDIVKSNKTTKQLFNRSMALADNPEMENKFATIIYNTINSSAGDILASQVKLINKMNDNVLKTYINSMSKTMARVDEATIKTLNNIEPEVLEKYVSKYLSLMDQVPTDKFANLIKGFENMPGGMASHIDSKIEQKIIDSILLDNKGLIDVFNKTKPEIFDKIPDDVKVELSNKIHVYTDKKHIAEAVDFVETPKFKEIENTIKSKFPYIYNENFEAKLKAYYIANNTGNPDDFIKYVENINVKELMEISPRIAKFKEEQLIEFLNYHHQKGTELTAENLTYQGSLTKDMQKDLMDYDKLSQVLSRFPNTDRRIGHLPQEWINGIPKEKQRDFANNIYEKINEFVTSNKDATSTAKLQSDLSQMFGENVLVQELGTGNYGTGYKITVGNRKPFVLKAFNKASNDFKGYNVHGQTIEPQNAMYAKGRSNDFAGFYFGRAADKFDNDGFMLVEFLPKKTGPEKPRDLSIQRLTSADFDAEQNHNFQNGKIIDYGAMMPVDKKLLEDKGVARYTRIITENMIALKGSDTYGFNDVRLNIVKNAVQKADNPMQVVEAINVIEHNVVKNIDEKSLQELKQIKKDVFIKYIKAKKPDVDAEAYFAAYDLNDKISNIENMIRNSFKGTGLNQGVTFSSRTKSVQSMYDKIHSNMEEKHLSLDEALKKVQDGYGLRTIMEDFDYKKYPEIVEMYKKDPEKAYRMAAEKQSEHIVEMLKDVLTRQINSGDFEIMTLSNYKGQDGIPYLSDKQVKELMEYANQRGVKLDVKTDDNGFAENVKDSGYTAFQMNLKYKDGTVVEWQTRGRDVDNFAEVEHIMYDSRQDKDLTGGRDVLKPLYEPYKKLIKDMKDDMFNEHMEYLTEYYKQLRLKELGFDYKLPEMNPKFDPRISAENLFKLHDEKERILHNQRK